MGLVLIYQWLKISELYLWYKIYVYLLWYLIIEQRN